MAPLQQPMTRSAIFSVDFSPQGDGFTLHGELDVSTAPTLDAMIDLVSVVGADIVLDLRDLKFIDSIGLTRFVRLRLKAEQYGHRLVLRRPPPNVLRVLRVTGLDTVMPVES